MVINREQFINAENNSVRLLLHISRLYSLLYNGYYKEKYKYLIEAFIKRAGDNKYYFLLIIQIISYILSF